MKVLHKIQIEVASDLNALDRVLLQFNQIYQDYIPERDWLECRLALAEGFTNAVRHAHKHLSKDIPIKIEILLTNKTIEIRIWDWGAAFDLQDFITRKSRRTSAWLTSGRGIPILLKIADHLDYYRTEQKQNCLLIVKNLSN
ncbi:MAG: ATP-binding protein [Pleurocapsa sp.]